MKVIKISFSLAICFFLIGHGRAQADSVKVTPLEYQDALNNPFKGFRQNMSRVGEYPYDAIVRTYIKWNEIERNGEDGIDRILDVCNQKWSGIADNNTKVIPRVYLDWDSKPGNEYWPEDMQSGDYSSEQFKRRVEQLVVKLGKAWDNDSRVAWIQMGIIGYWGEHHSPKPVEWQQELLGDLFSEAFKNKKVLVRRPFETFEEYEFGWYWDRFAHYQQAVTQGEVMLEKLPDRWKTVPMEGEVGYGAEVGDRQPGETPNETLRDPHHREWLIDWIRKAHCTGLGWISNYSLIEPDVSAGAEEVQKAFGYRFMLKEVTYPRSIQFNQSFSVSFAVQNAGSAPFYYNWPVELRLLDPVSRAVKWKQVMNGVDICDWMPGEEWNVNTREYDVPAPVIKHTAAFKIDDSLPKGKYILAIAILDPAGMVPSVKFATAQYFKGGNHPVGYIGVDSSIAAFMLDPSVFDDPSDDNSLFYEVQGGFQSPYGGTNRTIPGIIEAEHYDEGGEGLAYHDDDSKQGDPDFRPEDHVDVVSRAGASNGAVVSFTKESEWLEYTADVLPGRYDITLRYYCGGTPGDLVVHLDGNVIDTIGGLRNRGWDQQDSVTVENVLLSTGGENKVLRLECIHGAGFDIDAIRFTRLYTPVSGVTLSTCPPDTLLTGELFQLTASVDPPYANDPTVSWNSSDEQVATVDTTGLITGKSEGTATIAVTTSDGGFKDECQVHVVQEIISVYGVTIGDCPQYVLEAGNTHQLIALVAPPDATDRAVTWSSSNPSVATVDSTGLVTANSQGTATITITTSDGGYTSTCDIGVMATQTRKCRRATDRRR